MSEHHHRSAHYIADHLLAKWRNNQWNNSFVSSNVTKAHSPSGFPSPDADFQDKSLNTKISIEFKPETETKRGMMTGLGQSIAYLQKANASYLVSSRLVDNFDMGSYLITIFQKFIYGKLPVGLVLYDVQYPSKNLTNIKIECDIDQALSTSKHLVSLTEASYWCFWRDWPPDGFYKLALAAKNQKTNSGRNMKVWEYFFDTYFSPQQTRINLDQTPGDVFEWDMKTKMVPFSTKKRQLKIKLDSNQINLNDALEVLKKEGWGKTYTDNLYKDYKKNYVIFMNHLNLWDENFYLTPLGERFISRFAINQNMPDKLKDEIAQLILVEGKHDNLISDIIRATLTMKISGDQDNYLDQLYDYFDNSGYISKNPERTTSGIRKFFTAERQLWGHLDLILKNGGTYFFSNQGYIFNRERIEYLVDEFYKNYGDVSSHSDL